MAPITFEPEADEAGALAHSYADALLFALSPISALVEPVLEDPGGAPNVGRDRVE